MNVTKRLLLLPGALLFCASVAMAEAPTTIFQLDGNAANSNLTCSYGTPCDYWNLLNGSGNTSPTGGIGNNSSAGHSNVRTFINGNSAPATRFGLGTEDTQDTGAWSYQTKNSGPKTTLNAAYAAGYSSPTVASGDFIL